MRDIAQSLGVSIAVVSYVMSGREGRVSSEMEVKIRAAAAELHYQPNLVARSLKSGRTNILGLIVADISNPFFAHIARIIEDTAKQHGYTVIFGSSDESMEKSQDLIDTFLNRQVDGLIIAPAAGTEHQVQMLQKKKIPFVLIDRYFPGIEANSIRIDNFRAAYEAADCLLKAGRSGIALVSYKGSMEHVMERERGYRKALEDHGIALREEWLIKASYQRLRDDVEEGLERVLRPKSGVDSILFSTNSLAIEGLKQLYRMGRRIPNDVAVISFDESDAFDLFYVPITYIRQSLPAMGKEAVRLVLKQIGQKKQKAEEIVVAADLVQGASCGSSSFSLSK